VVKHILAAVIAALICFNLDTMPPAVMAAGCDDFTSQAAAQAYLRANPSDPTGLDLDNDGIACPALPAPRDPFNVTRQATATPTPFGAPTATITPSPVPTATATIAARQVTPLALATVILPVSTARPPVPATLVPQPPPAQQPAAPVLPTPRGAPPGSPPAGVVISPPSTGDAGLR
jgi:hypothetical protein